MIYWQTVSVALTAKQNAIIAVALLK